MKNISSVQKTFDKLHEVMKIPTTLLVFVIAYFINLSFQLKTKTDVFTDSWGYNFNWTNLEEGWNQEKQKLALKLKKAMLKQSYNLPRFTKIGYKKLKTPSDLHSFILRLRNLSKLEPETCEIPNAFNNCYRIKKQFSVPNKNGTRELIGIKCQKI